MKRRKEPILKFKKDNLLSINFFTKGIQFPIAVAAYTEWEEQQISYMSSKYEARRMNSEEICRWCIVHGIKYQIMYPLDYASIIKNPVKYYEYIKMKNKLKKDI